MIIYGLKNCDTCRKARKAVEAAGKDVVFRDVRAEPLERAELAEFLERLGPDLVNRRSTTWRGLSDAERAGDPLDLLAAHPSLMKRPVVQFGDALLLGWSAQVQAQVLA